MFDQIYIIIGWPYTKLIEEYISFTTKELGTIKMNDIIKKLNNSNKVNNFLIQARRQNVKPGSDDFLACIHSSTSFVFSNAETIAVATISLLIKWHYHIGMPNNLSDDQFMNQRILAILKKCSAYKTHVWSTRNFFDRFNDHLNNLISEDTII